MCPGRCVPDIDEASDYAQRLAASIDSQDHWRKQTHHRVFSTTHKVKGRTLTKKAAITSADKAHRGMYEYE